MTTKHKTLKKRFLGFVMILCGVSLILYGLISFSIWSEDYFWIERSEAKMPVWVEGNTSSGVFIIFVHGGPGSSGTLESIIEVAPANGELDHVSPLKTLEDQYAVVYWDQRHSGMSKGTVDPNTSTIEDFGKDLELVVSEVSVRYDVKSLFIIGQSFGHAVAVEYLTELDNWSDNQLKIDGYIDYKGNHEQNMPYQIAREKMLKTTSENINLKIDSDYWQEVYEYYISKEEMTALSDMEHHSMYISEVMETSISLMDRIISSVKVSILSPFNGLAYYPNNKRTNSAEEFMKQIMFDQSLSSTLERLSIPTLLVYGKNDLVAPPEVGEFIFKTIATKGEEKKLVILNNSRHGAEGEDVPLFQNEMIQFIENIRN